jgi:3-hydroxyisobutyrate dehydrogenase-like beta-hydroxyacid dehydrogenase
VPTWTWCDRAANAAASQRRSCPSRQRPATSSTVWVNPGSTSSTAPVSEGVTLAVKSGVEPDLVLEVIGNSLAANAVASHIFPQRVLPRDFSPKFRLDLESKDLALAQRLAQDNGAPFLLGALTASLFGTAVGRGLGGSDVSRLAELYEQLGDVTIGHGSSDA